MIRYVSTRGGAAPCDFQTALMAGLAPDGGLYVPDSWPEFDTAYLRRLAGLSYAEIAMHVIAPFVGDSIPVDALRRMINDTYDGVVFDHRAVAPLVQIGPNAWVMELHRGPTLSFKDYALQLVGRLFDYVLSERQERLTIIGATSGDTGSAAIEATRHADLVDIFILHPQGRTSDIQRRQMTTIDAPNVHNFAVEGTFDDCQALVKSCFNDPVFRGEMNLSAINSINWARIMAQIVYYFTAAIALGTPDRAISFAVPTGNFGNVYAGWAARRMGLPVHSLTIASNRNDILTRFFETGTMAAEAVIPSMTPSMDIQISSNFERYLFDLLGRDAALLRDYMKQFAGKRKFTLPPEIMARARQEFNARRAGDEDTLAVMRACYEATGYMIDPHTAVGLHAASAVMPADPDVPMVVLACAHPAKFPESVEMATDQRPPMPARLAAVLKKAEHVNVMANSPERLKALVRQMRGK